MPQVGKRLIELFVDSIDMSDAASNARYSNEDTASDFISFATAAANSAKDWYLEGTCVQDTTADSLWDYMWSQTGTDVTAVLWPNGQPVGGTPTVSQPSYTATVTIALPDGDTLGGDADTSSTARQTVDFKWQCAAKPTKATA
jgi:hypothetical protein